MKWLAWWNLLFLLPGSAGLVLAFLSAIGVGSDHEAESDHDHDHDHDNDHDHGQGEHHGEAGFVSGALSLLGVGRVPLMILLTMLFLFFGFIGVSVNLLLARHLPPISLVPVALLTGLLGSYFLTASFGRAIARIVPKEESYATSFEKLVGQTGHVVLVLGASEAYTQVTDRFGNFQEIRCKELDGKPLHQGQAVLITSVDVNEHICFVVENDLDSREDSRDGEYQIKRGSQ
jgi:amino acid transporter